MQGESAIACLNERLPAGNGVRIPIQRNHVSARGKDRRRIAAGTKGTIEDDLASLGFESPQDFREKNRNVAGRSATGVVEAAGTRHHSVSPVMRPVVPSCRNRDSRARASVL